MHVTLGIPNHSESIDSVGLLWRCKPKCAARRASVIKGTYKLYRPCPVCYCQSLLLLFSIPSDDRSKASSFKWEYPLLSLRSSSSFLRLLPRLLVTSISPFIFPSITCFRRQFLRKMWPIHLAFRFRISRRIFLCSLTLRNKKDYINEKYQWHHRESNSASTNCTTGCPWTYVFRTICQAFYAELTAVCLTFAVARSCCGVSTQC